jgi:photosystem I P700 chlorophyll a apoprotein A2
MWSSNPLSVVPIAHIIWDPHFGSESLDAYSSCGSNVSVLGAYSGVYNWLYLAGFVNSYQLYQATIASQILSVFFLLLAKLHLAFFEDMLNWFAPSSPATGASYTRPSASYLWTLRILQSCFDLTWLRLNYHLGALLGVTSLCWSGHIIHVSLPSVLSSYSNPSESSPLFKIGDLVPIFTAHWSEYGSNVLSFRGGINPSTTSLYLTDLAHHHVCIGVLFLWLGHIFGSTSRSLGVEFRDLISLSNAGALSNTVVNSLHLQISLSLIGLSLAASVTCQHSYSLLPYPFLVYDTVSTISLYVHHVWISSLLILGAFSHASIFLVRDYSVDSSAENDPILVLLQQKACVVSHLSWISLWLGFHTCAIFVHNDTVVAFGEPDKQILFEPICANFIQGFSVGYAYSMSCIQVEPSALSSFDSIFLPLSPGDFLSHHSIALSLHVTTLISLKGALDARGSRLMPDKIDFGFSFSCDGPGRGGTCDLSSWDSFYLAFFWMLNTDAWIIFYSHWRLLTLENPSLFAESSTYLYGWFRDYLWSNSSSLINGYSPQGVNDLALFCWAFLAAHLCWAVGFMFLISWRGYWQELLDNLLYSHLTTPILMDLWQGDHYSPVAISIVQARFIGLFHFSVGFIATYFSFLIASTL